MLNRMENFGRGVKDGIPIGLGYFAVSFTFGMMGVASGLKIWQVTLISFMNLTSAGQFAGLPLIVGGGSCYELALTQLIINMRYCLMSFALSQKLERHTLWFHRFIMAYGVTDEIFGISVNKEGRLSPYYTYGAMSVAIPGWTLGTLAGAISGQLLPPFMMSALGVAIYGMFLAIIIPPAKKEGPVLWVILAAMGLSTLFAFGPVLRQISSGFVIIITTLVVAGTAAWLHPVEEKEVSSLE